MVLLSLITSKYVLPKCRLLKQFLNLLISILGICKIKKPRKCEEKKNIFNTTNPFESKSYDLLPVYLNLQLIWDPIFKIYWWKIIKYKALRFSNFSGMYFKFLMLFDLPRYIFLYSICIQLHEEGIDGRIV